jgi:hypothetical protein
VSSSPDSRSLGRRACAALLVALALGACGGSDGGAGPSRGAVLGVTVNGLPGGTAARITVQGPSGAREDVVATTRLEGLAAGAYIVKPRYVVALGQTWTPAVLVDTVSLTPGDSTGVQVDYTGGPAPTTNVSIAGYSVIQVTQRGDNSVPLVGGRAALLRVFVTASGGTVASPVVRVRLYSAGVVVDSFEVGAGAATVPAVVDTSSLASSWNALLPAARVAPGLGFSIEVDPDDQIPETDKGDNRFPAAGAQAVTAQNVPAFLLRFVPVTQAVNNLTGSVTTSSADTLIDFTRRLLPLGVTVVNVRSPFTTNAPAYTSNDDNGAWSQTLSEMSALRTAEGATRHYVGVIKVTYGGGIAGLGYIGWPASISWDKPGTAPSVIAHELGHNFGRLHAPCGNPSGPDAGYPANYPSASIGTWGLDLQAMVLRPPTQYKDVMSYCDPDWISDYNYTAIMSYRGVAPAVGGAPSEPGLLVWGRIRNGNAELEPGILVDAPARLPATAGPHRVEGLDQGGNRVFSLSFSGELVADLPGGEERHFAFVVPLSPAERQRVAALRLAGRGRPAQIRAVTSPTAPTLAPAVRASRDASGTTVQWNPAYPLAVIRDDATGEILSFARGGSVTIPARGRPLRVEVSNGVTTLPPVRVTGP